MVSANLRIFYGFFAICEPNFGSQGQYKSLKKVDEKYYCAKKSGDVSEPCGAVALELVEQYSGGCRVLNNFGIHRVECCFGDDLPVGEEYDGNLSAGQLFELGFVGAVAGICGHTHVAPASHAFCIRAKYCAYLYGRRIGVGSELVEGVCISYVGAPRLGDYDYNLVAFGREGLGGGVVAVGVECGQRIFRTRRFADSGWRRDTVDECPGVVGKRVDGEFALLTFFFVNVYESVSSEASEPSDATAS